MGAGDGSGAITSARRRSLRQENADIQAQLDPIRAKVKQLRLYLEGESGLYHCVNNPDASNFVCRCGTPFCQDAVRGR